MARFAVLYTLHVGRQRRHIVDAWIEGAPEGARGAEIAEALKSSAYREDFSDRGVFLGNRRVLRDALLPKEYVAIEARSIPWEELSGPWKDKVQLDVRVSSAEHAAYVNAAAAAGLPLAEWVRRALGEKAGVA